jgi:4-hydroxy-4-methyl-2-oxoglutarate aldolase
MWNLRLAAILLLPLGSFAQGPSTARPDILKYTAKNPYSRFEDGRPRVPDELLDRIRELSSEEIWTTLTRAGYNNQFEGGWQMLHPEKLLVGRAVTAQYMPLRPDMGEVTDQEAAAKGMAKGLPQRVIDILQPNDVVVVDLFGKITFGTFGGDNLHTAIWAATKTGFVIDGSIRDLNSVMKLASAGYYRGATPTSYREVMLTGINVPVRIGAATVLPGDIVFGDREGLTFIPPHLIENILNEAEITHIHDEWTKAKLLTGKYKSSELYPSPSDPVLKREYEAYLKKKLAEKRAKRQE